MRDLSRDPLASNHVGFGAGIPLVESDFDLLSFSIPLDRQRDSISRLLLGDALNQPLKVGNFLTIEFRNSIARTDACLVGRTILNDIRDVATDT